MKTDDLILKLSDDLSPVDAVAPPFLLTFKGLVLSAALTLALMAFFHWRRDFRSAASSGPFLPSTLGLVASAALFAFASFSLAIPGRRGRARALGGAAAILAATALVVALAPFRSGLGALGGGVECSAAVALLSLAPALVLLRSLRALAPERPGLAGACVGLASAALGAAGLAFICPNDHPLHLLGWHIALPALAATALASLLGTRILRW